MNVMRICIAEATPRKRTKLRKIKVTFNFRIMLMLISTMIPPVMKLFYIFFWSNLYFLNGKYYILFWNSWQGELINDSSFLERNKERCPFGVLLIFDGIGQEFFL